MQGQLYDIYDMWHTPFWQTRLFYWVLLIVGLLCLGLLCIYIVSRLCAKKRAIKPWDHAISQLESAEQRYHDSNDEKQLYCDVTFTVKHYLQNRYGMALSGFTDQELTQYLVKTTLPQEVVHDVEQLFTGSVYIKFANARAAKERIARDIAVSKVIIEKTIPLEK